MTRTALVVFTLLTALHLLSPAAYSLDVGDPAPEVVVPKWIHGEGLNPAKPDGEHIYLVEFWATWCGPCRESIPHMNKLWAKYKDKGVVMMGLTTEGATLVEPFLEEIPIDYHVGLDTEKQTTPKWLGPNAGIPQAFLVGKDGTILWRGHPMSGLDYVLKKAVAGEYTKEEALAVGKAENDLQAAIAQNNLPAIEQAALALRTLQPDNPERISLLTRVYLHKKEYDKANEALESWLALKKEEKDPEGLLAIADTVLGIEDMEGANPALAVKATKAALSFEDKLTPMTLAQAAMIHAALGAPGSAIPLMEKAVAEANEREKPELVALLGYIKRLKAVHEAE